MSHALFANDVLVLVQLWRQRPFLERGPIYLLFPKSVTRVLGAEFDAIPDVMLESERFSIRARHNASSRIMLLIFGPEAVEVYKLR